jgi:hypothetical protein
MKNREEIKEEEMLVTKDFSDKKLNRYILLCKFLKYIFNEKLFWTISIIPLFLIPFLFHISGVLPITPMIALVFVLVHFLYWHLRGRKDVKIMIDDTIPELNIVIEVLEEIKDERNG